MIIRPIHRPLDLEVILNSGEIFKYHIEYDHDDFIVKSYILMI